MITHAVTKPTDRGRKFHAARVHGMMLRLRLNSQGAECMERSTIDCTAINLRWMNERGDVGNAGCPSVHRHGRQLSVPASGFIRRPGRNSMATPLCKASCFWASPGSRKFQGQKILGVCNPGVSVEAITPGELTRIQNDAGRAPGEPSRGHSLVRVAPWLQRQTPEDRLPLTGIRSRALKGDPPSSGSSIPVEKYG